MPSKSAIFQARARLGSQPLVDLCARVAKSIGGTDAVTGISGVWVAGRRLVAVDGTCLDVADTAANEDHFGRPGVNKGEQAAFPVARVLAVAECGTHAILAPRVGAYCESEAALAGVLLPSTLKPGMLLSADRGFFSYALWRASVATGADLLWRIRTDKAGPKPVHVEDLADGSWLAPATYPLRCRTSRGADPGPCHRLHPRRRTPRQQRRRSGTRRWPTCRRLTTLLDPVQASAVELAGAYAERWEIESAFDEVKTHQRGPRVVLRSKSPDLVCRRSGATCAVTTRSGR